MSLIVPKYDEGKFPAALQDLPIEKTIYQNERLGDVTRAGPVSLDQCPSVASVKASHVTLFKTKVIGDVTSSSGAIIADSTIEGRLTCNGKYLKIENSNIDEIIFNYDVDQLDKTSDMSRNFDKYLKTLTKGNHPCQLVVLINSTVGHIRFESGKGDVKLCKKSDLTTGITGIHKIIREPEETEVEDSA